MPDDEFLAQLKAFEGREIAGLTAPDEVNQAMIRHWVQAMGDTNPVYVDADAAAASVHGQIIAPAVMLQAWTSQGLRQTSAGRGSGEGPVSAQDELLNLVETAGFTSVVATNCEQEYHRMLHLGDRLMTRSVIESVSEEKQTGLGVGHFITTRIEYLTTDGEPVGRQLFRILKFKPGTGRNVAGAGDRAKADSTPPGSHRRDSGGRTELGDDAATVEPDVLAAHQPVTELPEVEHPEGDPLAVARQTEELARHRTGAVVLDHAEVIAVVGARDRHRLGREVGCEVVVEAGGRGLAELRTGREPDDVVHHVVGVDGNGACDVARHLGRDVVVDESLHLRRIHSRPLLFWI